MEETIVNFLIQNSDLFSTIGIYIVFFAGLLESLPLFGFLIPGHTLIILAGFMSHLAGKGLLFVIISAVIGVIFGDILSFYLGRKYGLTYLKKHGFKYIKPENILKIKETLENHLGKTLFIGRMNSLTRSIAPFIAGTTDINTKKFIFFTIIGGTLWSSISVLVGYLLGQSFDILGLAIGKFIFVATIIVIIVIASTLYAKKWNFHTKSKNIILLIIAIISIYIFASVAESAIKGKAAFEFNFIVHEKALIIGERYFHFFDLITNFGEKTFIGAVTLIVAVYLYYKKRRRDFLVFTIAMSVAIVSVLVIKKIVMFERPVTSLITETGFSFPSGHATLSACMFTLLSLMFSFRKKIINYIWIIICIAFPILISASRVYLGVHWFSDVFAGFFFGISIACFSYLIGLFYPWFFAKIRENRNVPNL